jgi:hypothetical protein
VKEKPMPQMTMDEYIFARDIVVNQQSRYNIYRHVTRRLYERFGIRNCRFRMAHWQRMSYLCATRQIDMVRRAGMAIFCESIYDGQKVMWVYSRELRCIVTAYTREEKPSDNRLVWELNQIK